MNRVTLTLLTVVFLSACNQPGQIFGPTPTPTPTASELHVLECRELFPEYRDEMQKLVDEFSDDLELAFSTSRIGLSPIVADMQEARRKMSDLDHPGCVAERHELYIGGVEILINEIVGFLADADYQLSNYAIEIAVDGTQLLRDDFDTYDADSEIFYGVVLNRFEEE